MYNSLEYSKLKIRYSVSRDSARTRCLGSSLYLEDFGRIASPGFPLSNYPNKLNCFWKIWAPINHGIKLTFNLTNLADAAECSDKIQIFRGFRPSDGNKRFRDICGTSTSPISLSLKSNLALVRFFADWSQTASGFLMSYSFFSMEDKEHSLLESIPTKKLQVEKDNLH